MTERADARGQAGQCAPSMLLDRVDQLRVSAFDTQKLFCVGMSLLFYFDVFQDIIEAF